MTRLPRGESFDRLVAAVLVVAGQAVLWAGSATPGAPKAAVAPLAIVITGSVAWRRRWPLATDSAALLCSNGIFLMGARNYSIPLAIAWMCALYAIAVWTDTRAFLIGFGVLVATNLMATLGPVTTPSQAGFYSVVPGVAMVIARRAVRERQLLAENLAARAEVLEHEQEARANAAVGDERARIARELHDLVAHNVSVMVVQAGAERHALADDQASTREALTSIEQAGRQALAEARRLLGILRRNGDSQELEPQPSLDQIGALVEQIERAGLPVELEVQGERPSLPAGLDLCAYRIVQESLTNALKHAGEAQVAVLLRYAPAALEVRITDNGHGTTQPNGDGAGHGLVGMRERVALYGGQLAAGPREGGGFEVHARLPLS